eukprot:Pgem_evm1s2949
MILNSLNIRQDENGLYTLADGNLGVKKTQKMNFVNNFGNENDPIDVWRRGKSKGIKIILQERRLWVEGVKLDYDKIIKKNGCKGRTCCARRMLQCQPDFREQKSIIEELIPRYGHKVQNLPKFHCELNPTEMLWGAAKRYSKRECDYTTAGLRTTIPDALES